MKISERTARFYIISFGLILAAWLFLPYAGPVDDAYITMTYSRNLAHGNGMVFNPGENVEGCTAFGQMLILAVFSALGIVRIDHVAVILGILAWSGALTLGYRLYIKDRESLGRQALSTLDALFLGFLIVCPSTIVWATSAMETPIVGFLWMAALIAHLKENDRGGIPWASALLTAAAGLMRPDGILVAVPLGLSWLLPLKKERIKTGFLYGGLVLLLFGGYWIWRWQHFGFFWPNTFSAKVGKPSGNLAGRGIFYVLVASIALVFPALFTILLVFSRNLWAKLPRWFWISAGMGYLCAGYAIMVGGDFFPYHRFLVPALTPGALAALALFRRRIDAKRIKKGKPVVLPVNKALVVFLLGLWWVWALGSPILDIYKARWLVRWTADWAKVGRQLNRMTPEDATIATLPIGAIGYFSHRRILDIVGLTDLHIGQMKQRTGSHIVGHEKYDTRYVLDRRPELILTWPVLFEGLPEKVNDWQYAHTIAWAQRDIYLTPKTFELYTPMSVEMKGGVVMGLLRSDLVTKNEWADFKPLSDEMREKFFKPELFRKVKKPTWEEAFDDFDKRKKEGKPAFK